MFTITENINKPNPTFPPLLAIIPNRIPKNITAPQVIAIYKKVSEYQISFLKRLTIKTINIGATAKIKSTTMLKRA